MTSTRKSVSEPALKRFSIHREGKMDPIMGRIDLVAIVIGLLGVCLLGLAALVLGAIELARLIGGLWSDSFDRWVIITLSLAVVWVIARWKKLCVF